MLISFLFALSVQQVGIPELGVMVFSKTATFRHDSIADGKKMFERLASENAWIVTTTEDAVEFTENLKRVRVVVFLSTTGDVLNDEQQLVFEKWFRAGGGYVGIHAAADTEYDWPFYGRLVGGYFARHPQIQLSTIAIEDKRHKATKHLPAEWTRSDEWYDYKANPRGAVYVLASLKTDSVTGSEMVDDHPIIWCHDFEGGRAFYSGLGHTAESYTEKAHVEMIKNAILWAAKKF